MKNITLLVALLATFISSAQNFPGTRPELLSGKEVKIIPLGEFDKKSGYRNFTTDYEMTNIYAKNEMWNTKADSLVGRTFKVEKVEPFQKPKHTGAIITLKDVANGKILYYSYHSGLDDPSSYPFEVIGGLSFPADFYCEYITFTQQEGLSGDYVTQMEDGIQFTKNTESGVTMYMVEIRQNDAVRVASPKNATLILENNKTIIKPDATVGVTFNGSGSYIYIATFVLKPAEVELLQNNKIVSGKIHTIESKVINSDKLKGMFGCLVTK